MTPARLADRLLEQEEEFTPSPSDIAWTRQQYAMLKHGGIWIVPGSRSIWKIDKVERAYVLKHGDPDHPLNRRIKAVVEAAGYRAIIDIDPSANIHFTESVSTGPKSGQNGS